MTESCCKQDLGGDVDVVVFRLAMALGGGSGLGKELGFKWAALID